MIQYNQKSDEERDELYNQFLQEPDSFYERAEMDQLRNALNQSYTERFLAMTKLMKLGIMLSKAKITYSPSNTK